MTYEETVDYLYSRLPMFAKKGKEAIKPGLDNIRELCKAFDNPQDHYPVIHIAGTNGKGSTAHLLSAILQEAGYKTGLFTSPHLKAYTERFKINGKEIEQEAVVDFVNRVQPLIDKIEPSFFEISSLLAFDFFSRQKADIVIVETGLGGRLDTTNIVNPVLSVITRIGYDHQDILGNTLEEIANEKAGIIKSNTPVVLSADQPELKHVFAEKAAEQNAAIYFASDEYKVKFVAFDGNYSYFDVLQNEFLIHKSLATQLNGYYQHENFAGVFKIASLLPSLGFAINEQAVKTGIEKVCTLTGLKGRWQQLQYNPLIVCDTAHNEEAFQAIVEQLKILKKEENYVRVIYVLGFSQDKDLRGIFSNFSFTDYYIFCRAGNERAMPAEEIGGYADLFLLEYELKDSVNAAIERAKAIAGAHDIIFIGGSTFVVAEIENL